MTHQLLTLSGGRTPNRMKFMLACVFVVVACGGDGGATQGGSPGAEGNHCYPNGTCNSGLLCHHKPPLDMCEKASFDTPAPPVAMGGASGTPAGAGGTCLNCNGGVSGTPAGAGDTCSNCNGGASGTPAGAGGTCLNCGGVAGGGGAPGGPCTTDVDCAGADSCVLCSFGTVVCSKCESGHCSPLNPLSGTCVRGGLDYGIGSYCGNGYLNAGEECDGANLNGATCDSVSSGALPFGKLFCSSTCTRVLQGCSSVPVGTGGATGTGGVDAGRVTDAAPG